MALQLCEAAKSNKYCDDGNPTSPMSSDFLTRGSVIHSNSNSPLPASAAESVSIGPPTTPVRGKSDAPTTPGAAIGDLAGSETGPAALDLNRMSENLMSLWIEFMDGVSLLQCIDLDQKLVPEPRGSTIASNGNTLEENTRIAFFVNLYHLLVLHGFLVIGPAKGVQDFIFIFTKLAYEVSGDILTLSEIEHCVLRNGMAKPNLNIFANMHIPSHKYSFSLNCRRDFRLMWALNCGSVSNFPYITIYRGETLGEQLDTNVELSLNHQLQVNVETGSIVLPQMIQWFQKDFETNSDGSAANSSQANKQLLTTLSKYIGSELHDVILNKTASVGKSVKITYTPFSFTCRYLEGYGVGGIGFPNC